MSFKLPKRNTVRILLLNTKNKILLMCADDPSTTNKDGAYRGRFWFTIGGAIEQGETLQEAAIREIHEETGLDVKDVTFGPNVWYGAFDLVYAGTLTRINEQFVVAYTDKSELTMQNLTALEKKVIKEIRWFSIEEIQKSKEIIYPIELSHLLPDILAKQFPEKPLYIDLGKEP